MFSCVRVRRQLGACLDGEISPGRRTAVERHLVKCRSCRAALESLRRLERPLQAAEIPPVGPDLAGRIMSEARKRRGVRAQAGTIRLHQRWSAPRTWVFRTAAAAVLVFGLAAGSYMGWSAGHPTSQATMARSESLEAYNLDYLGDVPEGSLVDSYLALASDRNHGGYRPW